MSSQFSSSIICSRNRKVSVVEAKHQFVKIRKAVEGKILNDTKKCQIKSNKAEIKE
jgi:hypothetical protein